MPNFVNKLNAIQKEIATLRKDADNISKMLEEFNKECQVAGYSELKETAKFIENGQQNIKALSENISNLTTCLKKVITTEDEEMAKKTSMLAAPPAGPDTFIGGMYGNDDGDN